MDKAFEQVFSSMLSARETMQPHFSINQQGKVKSVTSGTATVTGLTGVELEQTLKFPHGVEGITLHIEKDHVTAELLNQHQPIHSGDEVLFTQQVSLKTSILKA